LSIIDSLLCQVVRARNKNSVQKKKPKKKFVHNSSRPEVATKSKPQLLIGGWQPVEPNMEKATAFKVSSQPAESRQH
jgi:hypothetical protein